MLKYFLFVILVSLTLHLTAQVADTITVKDAAKEIGFKDKFNKTTREIGLLFKDTTELQNPRKAILRSAIIPGWGQARNRQWWKVPIIYGGFVALGFTYNFNNQYYREFLAESQFRKRSTTPDDAFLYPQNQGISAAQIYNLKDFYRRNRDLTLYGSFGFYLLQIVEAYIGARLATFNVDDDLSMRIKPSIYIPSYASGGQFPPTPTLTLTIKL